MHARAGPRYLRDVVDAFGRLEQSMDHYRFLDAVLCLKLREQLIEIVDVPGPLDLRHHHHVELVADLAHEFHDVIENPRAVQRVDARPKPSAAEIVVARHFDEATPRRLFILRRDRVF